MILRFKLKNGKTTEFPYDFGESESQTLHIQQFWNLFMDEITDVDLVQGMLGDMRSSLLDRNSKNNREKDLIIQALHDHNYIAQDAAKALKVSPRKICYDISRFGLREWVIKMKEKVQVG